MLNRGEYRLLLGLSVLSVVLVALNTGLYFSNQALQASVNARAQYIQQSVSIKTFYQDLAKALAERALKNHDEQVRSLLSREGFTITPAPASPPPAEPARHGKP